MFSIFWGIYLGVELLSHMIKLNTMLNFCRMAVLFTKATVPFYITTGSITLIISLLKIIAILVGVRCYLIVVLELDLAIHCVTFCSYLITLSLGFCFYMRTVPSQSIRLINQWNIWALISILGISSPFLFVNTVT